MYVFIPWIALLLFALSAGLWKPMERSRGRFRSAIVFLVLWLALWAGTSAASWWHLELKVAKELAVALVALAGLQVVAGLAFDLVVERTKLPRFAAEMAIVAGYIAIGFNLFYQLGVNVTGIFATSAVATAVIGLALQDMMSNIASGISLEFENDIRVGDFIKCGDAAGWVQHVRLRHMSIETPDGDQVMLPNSFLTRSPVTVVARSRRKHIPFNMQYGCNPQEIIDAVTFALQASPIPGVAAEPAPHAIVLDMTPAHIQYAAIVWMQDPGHESHATSAVLTRIYFALQRAGMPTGEITYLLEMKTAPEGVVAKNPVDILRRNPIFRILDDPGLFELGARLRALSFAPGEVIIRQGQAGDSMYFVTNGQVAINHVGSDKSEVQVAVIPAGEFFGETSLLTGASRNANAIALTRVDCYELDKAGLEGIISKRTDLAEDMSVVVAHRQMELIIRRDKMDQETARLREAESQTQLLSRIRGFFGLKTGAAD